MNVLRARPRQRRRPVWLQRIILLQRTRRLQRTMLLQRIMRRLGRSQRCAGHTLLALGLAAVALAAMIIVAVPQAASAHDQIVDQFPQANDILADAPQTVTLEFASELMDITQLAMVVDAEGTDWVDGALQVTQRTATQTLLPDLPDGSYQVRWRVVASDGHPISGVFEFAVGSITPGATFGLSQPLTSAGNSTASNDAQAAALAVSPLVINTIIGAATGIALFATAIALRWLWLKRKK